MLQPLLHTYIHTYSTNIHTYIHTYSTFYLRSLIVLQIVAIHQNATDERCIGCLVGEIAKLLLVLPKHPTYIHTYIHTYIILVNRLKSAGIRYYHRFNT